ncbi:hypothetical protein GQ43DRAFT_102138 [Delitschia confertaspora ATCC 74209]|uniref:Uncharacterized protein n=1 Tax=Delitschia confertaspora ATCC 74209 TaxID=1513339 RepID=A0A9P4N2K7_9PLEO|nr:hypothetical protein GQ43DRAFT_102138 [Delitschia confertaspora ATCC 74209]
MTDAITDGPLLLPAFQWSQLLQLNRPIPRIVDTCIHGKIERKVRIRPDKVAVTGYGPVRSPSSPPV